MHDHYPFTFHLLDGGKAQVTMPDGKVNEREIPSGFTGHNGLGVRHKVKNIGSKELNIILIEHKKLGSTPTFDNDVNLAAHTVSPDIYKIVHEDDYKKSIKNVLGILDSNDLNLVDFKTLNSKIKDYDLKVKDRIAIIYAQGTILYVEGNETIIGEELFRETIDELRENENIKAVVLRIDSPGGDPLTSDILWNSIEKLKNNKPVVVSMGNVAASGGYYIACNANKILANPMTITGSIGVWGALPNLEGISSDIGINAEQVNTHKNSMGYSLFEPLQSGYKNAMERTIDEVYKLFKLRVSEGRAISYDEVENYARGHVWSGKEAKKIGLIDEIGGLQDAIYEASKLAEIENFNIVEYPIVEEDFESIFSEILPSIQFFNDLKKIKDITDPSSRSKSFENIKTLLPFKVKIK